MGKKHREKIAVTVVTGFLGSGKTTFINRILKAHPETQFALVENEFGDVSIDTSLIRGLDVGHLFELKQGCICCTITNEYEGVLQELAERFPNVEHLLIETTGIADPVSVIQPFFRDPGLRDIYSWNGCLCLVDALHFEGHPEQKILHKQIAVADEVIITKAEKLTEQKKSAFQNHIQALNPLIPLFFSDDITFSGHLGVKNMNSIAPFGEISSAEHLHYGIESRRITVNGALIKEEFVRKLEYNLDVYKNEIYRIKGILCFEDELYETILQGVGGSFELTESDHLIGNCLSEIVLIGRNLPEDIF